MRSPRARKPVVGVSLFPFLAVLICTVGALIVLLVLIVKQADVSAQEQRQQDEANQADTAEQFEIQREREDFRRELLEEKRPELVRRLGNGRLELSHLEEQIRALREQAKQVEEEAADLKELRGNRLRDSDSAHTALGQLADQIEQARRDLEKAQRESSNRKKSFAIVPYDGPNGTRRRPIYIECTGDAVVIQPEGVVLKADDFDGPLVPGNPLDASLLATREYWQRYGGIGDQGEPYPLLIVRPSGAEAYAAARTAMKSWDDEFGYELIDDELQLKYPPSDPTLKKVLEQTIADARQRQQLLAASQPARFRDKLGNSGVGGGSGGSCGGVTFRASPTHGGFIREGGTPGPATDGLTNPFGSGYGPGSTGSKSFGGGSPGTSGGTAGGNGPPANARPGGGKDASTNQSANGANGNAAGKGNTTNGGSSQDGASQGGGPALGNASIGVGETESLSSTRGGEWALPSRSQGATAFRRPIRIACYADRLVVVPQRESQEKERVVPMEGATRSAVDPLVSAVWQRMEGWGIAGRNAYWKPELKLEVAPGGQQRAADLEVLMRGSGFDVERKTP